MPLKLKFVAVTVDIWKELLQDVMFIVYNSFT